MKKTMRILGIAVIAAAIVLAFTACDEPKEDPELYAKWYKDEGTYLVLAYEFKSNGDFSVVAGVPFGKFETTGKKITTKALIIGTKMGTIDYKIEGKEITFSNPTGNPGIAEGTFYKK